MRQEMRFDLKAMTSHQYSEREKNVFARTLFSQIIELPAKGSMPTCEMASHVLFYVVRGEAEVQVNQEVTTIKEGQCLITEPATLAMKTENGVKIMGIQVAAA
jgi:quercetin dioxygenase-like cupin family protein